MSTSNITDKITIIHDILKKDPKTNHNELKKILQQIAIQHLKISDSPTSKIFRGEHLPTQDAMKSEQHLTSKCDADNPRGTEVEAIAIAEALHMNLIIISIYENRTDETFCLHLENENSPTIKKMLDNLEETWY